MLYEYRMYEAVPGRLPDLLARFENITLQVWARYGIEQMGFWLAEVGVSNQLHYLLRWRDLADREARWSSFQRDPDWIARRAETEVGGPLVARFQNQFWKPTEFSAMK